MGLLNSPRRLASRVLIGALSLYIVRSLFFGSSSTPPHEVQHLGVIDRVTWADKLDVQRHPFLQARIGRDEREDIMSDVVSNGVWDYWERFQLPFIKSRATSHTDTQVVSSAIDELLALNGWVAAACPTLTRPFGQNRREDAYDDLRNANHLYFIAIVIHSADHFLVDQLAVIVQMAKRLGHQNIFVSMLDYDSTDATPTLVDLCEAVLILLGVPFRIRRVPGMTPDDSSAYYPLEEAYARNLVLEPLQELREKRHVEFHRVVWLKGFTCPNDIFETIKVSQVNNATMVCGMDWAEHDGFFIFSDRWRTRNMDGDQFRGSRSSAPAHASPPRDALGTQRYAEHLPFQVFCCEAGTHVVDPAQSYYTGLTYRSAAGYHNLTEDSNLPELDPEGECMDSAQAFFCRDLWVRAAREGERAARGVDGAGSRPGAQKQSTTSGPAGGKSQALGKDTTTMISTGSPQTDTSAEVEVEEAQTTHEPLARRQPEPQGPPTPDADDDAGSDFDAMPDSDSTPPPLPLPSPLPSTPQEDLNDPQAAAAAAGLPNSAYTPARILVNPRCVTTYAGVSHAQLAADLFGVDKGDDVMEYDAQKYVLEEWRGAPSSFVCQEQRHTGGRKATKTQRRLGFSLYEELQRW
ncbi:glycosyltransferase family 69 protein [Botryobasidium botryosum FD-172 SS1]|uniref:Glycosyltransferase family 69 protein n=1 Tax=Botryobasidium botryosum (strain FD-172 SS1) TaxID=930990 RepID=A0A067M132_BOTB1|nr:glycosyltransferase family 69 protein [Botryobasidium botryosum FD-172 SS1]